MSQRFSPPSVQQVRQLPLQLSINIPPEWEDHNGHVNVQFYLTLYEQGGYQILEDIGQKQAYFENAEFGMFDLQHHISYLAELRVGEPVSMYNRLLHMNAKRFHGMFFIVNDSQQKLACIIEYLTAGVDLTTRRTTPFPEAMIAGLAGVLETQRQLDWQAPECGAIRI